MWINFEQLNANFINNRISRFQSKFQIYLYTIFRRRKNSAREFGMRTAVQLRQLEGYPAIHQRPFTFSC